VPVFLKKEHIRSTRISPDKVNLPLVNSLLLHIAYDSRKHSTVLKGITESIAKTKKQPKDYEKKLFFGKTWTVLENLAKEIAKEQKIPKESMASLVKKLMLLESTVRDDTIFGSAEDASIHDKRNT